MHPIMKYNREIFQQTLKTIEDGHYTDSSGQEHDISELNKKAIFESVTIPDNQTIDITTQLNQTKNFGEKEKQEIFSRVEVTDESTAAAARRYVEQNYEGVCLLNFANGFQYGGGVEMGCTAQEETISRQSNLFFALKEQPEMYEHNRKLGTDFCSDYLIYSPDVVFFRNDKYEFVKPILASVISSPAVDLRGMYVDEEIEKKTNQIMKGRIKRILELAISKNVKSIILGAFGCGAFLNKPEDISQIFKELLVDEFYGTFFTHILFPIYGKSAQSVHNFKVFKATFNIK
ncbi:hypothetical protein M9Y10_036571 [Tritrichomonas musculus]|uniref:Microbial-type PARG catalytic domain-containing protein n=1 Tax=Tritrichomonas musculus TaxID=1915356 RepID=A0ABR2GV88_9EUKA